MAMELVDKDAELDEVTIAAQAEKVTQAFVTFLQPDKKEVVDYRIPSEQCFRESGGLSSVL